MNTENYVEHFELAPSQADFIRQIPLNKLRPLKDHAFQLYEGKKLDQMVQSIRENGIIQPGVARPIKDTDEFEIVSGHNRAKAGEQAGLTEIPFLIRNLSDDEAIILSNEANVVQRTFQNWLPSEKAKSIFQYHMAIKRQANRTDLQSETSGDKRQKLDDHARKRTADAYGVKESTIRQCLEISKLIEPLMERLDKNELGVTSAQLLCHIADEGQKLVNTVLDEDRDICKVTVAKSKDVCEALKGYADDHLSNEKKYVVRGKIREILARKTSMPQREELPSEHIALVFPKNQYDQWFSGSSSECVVNEILIAVEFYRNSFFKTICKDSSAPVATGAAQQGKSQEVNHESLHN